MKLSKLNIDPKIISLKENLLSNRIPLVTANEFESLLCYIRGATEVHA